MGFMRTKKERYVSRTSLRYWQCQSQIPYTQSVELLTLERLTILFHQKEKASTSTAIIMNNFPDEFIPPGNIKQLLGVYKFNDDAEDSSKVPCVIIANLVTPRKDPHGQDKSRIDCITLKFSRPDIISDMLLYLLNLFLNLVPIIPNFLILHMVCSTMILSLE